MLLFQSQSKTQVQQKYNTYTQYGNTKQTIQHTKCKISRKITIKLKCWDNKYFDDKFICESQISAEPFDMDMSKRWCIYKI
jgi:ribosomal protein L44E